MISLWMMVLHYQSVNRYITTQPSNGSLDILEFPALVQSFVPEQEYCLPQEATKTESYGFASSDSIKISHIVFCR